MTCDRQITYTENVHRLNRIEERLAKNGIPYTVILDSKIIGRTGYWISVPKQRAEFAHALIINV